MISLKTTLGVFGTRFFLIIALLSVLLVGSIGLLGFWNAKRTITLHAQDRLFTIVKERSSKLNMWFEERSREILLLGDLPQVRSLTKELQYHGRSHSLDSLKLVQILKVYQQTYVSYGVCGIFDITGKPLVLTQKCKYPLHNPSNYQEFQEALHTLRPTMGNIYLLDSGLAGINIVKAIVDDKGSPIGVLIFILLPENTINKILSDPTGLGQTGETYLVGADTVMLTPSRSRNHPPELTHKMPTEGVLNCLKGIDSVGIYHNLTGNEVVGAYVLMPGPRWALIAEMSTTEAFQPVYKFAIHFFFILGIGILLILLISIFISRKLTEPLFHLSEASNAVAQGDLNIQITPKSQDEIGRLTQQFNQMVNSLKKSRQEAEISHRKLLQSEKLAVIGRLVASIVHEMRNPLSAIKMNLRIIERKTLPVELEAQHLQIASEQTKRLEKMLNELLEFSKPVIPNLITVNLQEIFQQVISGKKSLLETKKISLVTDFPASPVICKSDPDLLTRILDNVLLNAIQASDKNQCIFMKIVLAQNITVEIRDEGKGMSLKVQDRLFEPFFTTRENGVGLGMPNVKKFLDLLGGIIVVDSGENKGTRIIIKLPL